MTRVYRTGDRLQFEGQLMSQLVRPRRRRRRVGHVAGFAVVAALVLVAGGLGMKAFSGVSLSSLIPQRWSGLEKTCEVLIDGLRTGNMASALMVCADSEAGKAALSKEDARIWNGDHRPELTGVRLACGEVLSAIRSDLAAEQVAWDQVRPLAFGGVYAKLFDRETMADPARSVTGNLYFASGDHVYAIELTARLCGSQYVVTDVWKCFPVMASPDEVSEDAKLRFREFQKESGTETSDVDITQARRVFIHLDNR